MVIGGYFVGVKRSGHEDDNLPPSSAIGLQCKEVHLPYLTLVFLPDMQREFTLISFSFMYR